MQPKPTQEELDYEYSLGLDLPDVIGDLQRDCCLTCALCDVQAHAEKQLGK